MYMSAQIFYSSLRSLRAKAGIEQLGDTAQLDEHPRTSCRLHSV